MNLTQLEGAVRSTLRLQDTVYNDMLLPEAAQGNDNTLWQTYRGGVATINRTWAFTDTPKPIELIEAEMRFQWRVFVLAAKHIDAHHPAQDRLAWLVLWTRETGVLSRNLTHGEGNAVVEQAVTTRGRIWADLPFMLEDVQTAWKETVVSASSATHCHNLTAGIARLAAVGLLDDAFSGCGLEIMVQALELPNSTTSTAAPVAAPGGSEQIDTQTEGKLGLMLPLLLPLIQAWLHYAGRKLLQLSVAMHSADQAGWSIDPESRGIDDVGFSTARFQNWKDELNRLEKHDFGDTATNETAMACSGLIDNVWDELFGVRARKATV